jgi:hypothetical protein
VIFPPEATTVLGTGAKGGSAAADKRKCPPRSEMGRPRNWAERRPCREGSRTPLRTER